MAPPGRQEPGDDRVRGRAAGARAHRRRLARSTTRACSTRTTTFSREGQAADHRAGDQAGRSRKKLWNDDIIFHINPTGKFVVGGPHGDTGLTGRKIIVDSYGGRGAHGGGAFSGKDPTKVDRIACYMGRYIAKNIVAAGLAEQREVQLAYAIGVANPVSVTVSTEGTAVIPEDQIAELVRKHFPLTPRGIIKHLDLLRPIYKQTARHGHFGRMPGKDGSFSWEKTDKAEALAKAVGIEPAKQNGRSRKSSERAVGVR